MTAPCAPLLAFLACALGGPAEAPPVGQAARIDPGVCPELRDLVPDLLVVDRMREGTSRYVVGERRVAELEERLGDYLGLPPALRVRLTTVAGHRREVAKAGVVSASVVHRASGVDLGLWTASWDGACVHSAGLQFLRADAAGPKTCELHRGASHYPASLLPTLFERLSEVAEVAAARPLLQSLIPGPGSIAAVPPFATARCYLRVDQPPGEASVCVSVRLPLATEPERSQPPPAGPRAVVRDLAPLLDTGLALLARIDLAFPHSIQLSPELGDPGVFELDLDPYRREHPPVPIRARLRREDGLAGEWAVADRWGRLAPGAVGLAAFVDVSNLVARIVVDRGRRVGAFGLARGDEDGEVAGLLVTVDAESLWDAERGTLHLLRAGSGGRAEVLEEVELPALETAPGVRIARTATTARGDVLRIEVQDGEILTRRPEPPVLRFRGRDYALLGGRALD